MMSIAHLSPMTSRARDTAQNCRYPFTEVPLLIVGLRSSVPLSIFPLCVVSISNYQGKLRFVSVMEARDPAGGWEMLDQGKCEGAGFVAELAGRPTGWCLERNHRQVMFAEGPELSVFSETTSAPVSSPHAHPAWTLLLPVDGGTVTVTTGDVARGDRKSTRLNSSHVAISYAVFFLK